MMATLDNDDGTDEESTVLIEDQIEDEQEINENADDGTEQDSANEEEDDDTQKQGKCHAAGPPIEFDKERSDKYEPPETVRVLCCTDSDQSMLSLMLRTSLPDDELDIMNEDNELDMATLLRDARCYLVGTAHFSLQSQNDVKKVIASQQPDVVMVELCAARVGMLTMDEQTLLQEASSLTASKIQMSIRDAGMVQGAMNLMLLSMSAHITKQLGMAPGGEFRAARTASLSVPGCHIRVGDRPIHITLQRALASLGFWQRLRFVWQILNSLGKDVSAEDVEKCKKGDMLEELLKEMAGEFPSLSEILINERDVFMAHFLRNTMRDMTVRKYRRYRQLTAAGEDVTWQPVVCVAVVGIGHQPGICTHWSDDNKNIRKLLIIPSASLTSRVASVSVKCAVLGATCYLLYRGTKYIYTAIRQ